MEKMSGACLCGKVTVSFQVKAKSFAVCHCGMCRKWNGGPAMAVEGAESVSFQGDIATYESSAWAERGFCPTCGTHLFYRLKDQDFYSLPLGLVDGAQEFKFHQQIYIDHKPANYAFVGETENLTEAQVLALFGN